MQSKYVIRPWWRLNFIQLIFLMFFLLFFGGSIYVAIENQRRNGYSPIQVTVTGSRIFVEEVTRTKKSDTYLTYKPMVFYRYVVDDIPYEGGRIWPSDDTTDKVTANEVIARYEVGKTYTAYYDQLDPGSSYLERKTSLQPYCAMVGAIGMFLPPVIMLGVKRRRDDLYDLANAPDVSPKIKREAAELEKRYRRRTAVTIAIILSVFSLCFVLAAIGQVKPTADSPKNSALMLRGMFVIFAVGMGGAAVLVWRYYE